MQIFRNFIGIVHQNLAKNILIIVVSSQLENKLQWFRILFIYKFQNC